MKKRLLILKVINWTVVTILALVALGALLIIEENIRSKWLWNRYKHEAEARGESFDFASFTPPAVPDEQNFFMTPLLKPIFYDSHGVEKLEARLLRFDPQGSTAEPAPSGWAEWWTQGSFLNQEAWAKLSGHSDVLESLDAISPELDELAKACRRPFSQPPMPEALYSSNRYPLLRRIFRIFALRAAARLSHGQADLALEDVETLLRTAKAAGEPPTSLSLMMYSAFLNCAIQPVWEGLAAHRWSEPQLIALQRLLKETDVLAAGLRDMRGERAFAGEAMPRGTAALFSFPLSCVVYQNLLTLSRYEEETVFPALDPAVRIISPAAISFGKGKNVAPWRIPYTILADLSSEVTCSVLERVAYAQTAVDEARIACALERYRLANGEYPEKLEALVPRYMECVPWDIVNGQPLHYERTADGLFVLYSVGWNGVDDHGAVPDSNDLAQGDWVWRYPAAHP